MRYESILETIGKTPLVRLNHLAKGFAPRIYVKIECFNPGNSVKDRIALSMIEDAEKSGKLKPGGTIIEGTSGNTGIGLAIVAAIRGYRCIFTIADKQSQEKIDMLRAFGAEVIVCPTNVEPEDPRSYYSVAKRLNQEIPNSVYPNQYDNLSNTKAHYETTGPEIWQDSEGKITHFVCGMGTCGTMSGVSKFLKEKNPKVQSIGVDTYGSVFKKYKETGIFDQNEIYPYITEGIGEDILPGNLDMQLVDRIEKVTDKDAMQMTRKLVRQEGLFVGESSGSAVAGALRVASELSKNDLMVILLPDHGSRYLGKVFNDAWMRSHGFLEDGAKATVQDILHGRKASRTLVFVTPEDTIAQAMKVMKQGDLSQLPVIEKGNMVGSITESKILDVLADAPNFQLKPMRSIMGDPFPVVQLSTKIDVVIKMVTRENPAVVVAKTPK